MACGKMGTEQLELSLRHGIPNDRHNTSADTHASQDAKNDDDKTVKCVSGSLMVQTRNYRQHRREADL